MSNDTERRREWAIQIVYYLYKTDRRLIDVKNRIHIEELVAVKLAELEGDPPAGLEETMRGVLDRNPGSQLNVVARQNLLKVLLAAVQPLFDGQQKRFDTFLYNDAYQIKLLRTDNAALKKQVEAILGLIGNVDHSVGNGEKSARLRGDLLNDIRTILQGGLG